MGIESDQLVYDYLSRVGDAAQQRHLPSGERMRLVSSLRNEIDRQRGKFGTDTPAAVRRILGRLGEPEALVRAAAERGAGAAVPQVQVPEVAVPEQRTGLVKGLLGPKGSGRGTGKGPGKSAGRGPAVAGEDAEGPAGAAGPAVPEQQPSAPPHAPASRPVSSSPPAAPASAPPPASSDVGVAPPRPAGTDEPRRPPAPPRARPDWWRIEPAPMDMGGAAGHVPGFVGGVEIPEILKPPPRVPSEPEEARKPPTPKGAARGTAGKEDAGDGAEADATDAASAAGRRGRGLRSVLGRRGARKQARADARADARAGGRSNPFLLLMAGLLVAGAFLVSWRPLAGCWLLAAGWLLAYASRTLSRAEAKWAVFGLPGISAAGGLVWLWGRMDRRWGEAIPKDGMADALSGVWPVALRTAAVTSALYLVWRARRKKTAG